MNKIVLFFAGISLMIGQSSFSQDFVYTNEQNIVANVQNENYESYNIDINTTSPQAIQYKWELLSNSFPSTWSYNLCDYNSCATGIPSFGTMAPISLTEAQNGVYGFLHLNLTVGMNYGHGVVQIYVYDATNYSIGDTVSWDITWENTTGLNNLTQSRIETYPNPVNDLLTIDLNSNGNENSIQILGLDGKVYYSEVTSNSNLKVDTSILPNGVFFVEIIDHTNRKTTHKIVKI